MSIKKLTARIVNKHGSAEKWNQSVNFIPFKGEIIVYDPSYDSIDGKTYEVARMKIGDGIHTIQELNFVNKYDPVVSPVYGSVEFLTHVGDATYTPAQYTPPAMTHDMTDQILTINFDAGSYTPAEYTPSMHESATLSYLEEVSVKLVTSTK